MSDQLLPILWLIAVSLLTSMVGRAFIRLGLHHVAGQPASLAGIPNPALVACGLLMHAIGLLAWLAFVFDLEPSLGVVLAAIHNLS